MNFLIFGGCQDAYSASLLVDYIKGNLNKY